MRNRSVRNHPIRSLVERLNGRTSINVYEAAKAVCERDDPATLRSVINTLKKGKRVMNRAGAAYALHLMHGKAAASALEQSLDNQQEHPKVRGQAAESLAHNHREKSHHVLLSNLMDSSKEVRFWCAYTLAEMGESEALIPLRDLVKRDHRIVRGFWSVSREARASIRRIREEMSHRNGRRKRCLFCPRAPKKRSQAS